jgi:N utilization substance protein B
MTGKPGRKNRHAMARSGARLAAVQALYQMDIAATPLKDILDDYQTLGSVVTDSDGEDAGEELPPLDKPFFRALVKGIVGEQRAIDPVIHGALRPDWPLGRIDSTLRAILRAGAFELLFRHDVPFRTVINEYLNIAHAFFEDGEPAMINGVLDHIARDCRADSTAAPDEQG